MGSRPTGSRRTDTKPAHLAYQPSWTSLTTKAPIVDFLGTCRLHLNSRTCLSVRRDLKNKPTGYTTSNGYLLTCEFMPGHAHMTRLESGQHFAVFWLAVPIS